MPAGRPKKTIDKDEFEKLCALQCTYTEICSWFDVTDKTLNNWCKKEYGMNFSDVFAIKREKGKISLRRAQFQLAQKNASMAIFLGKNYLQQTDTMRVESHMDGKLHQLIDSLKEPYDIYEEAKSLIGDMANESAEEN